MHKTTNTTGTTGDSVVVHQSSDEAPQNEADEDDDLCGLVNTDEYVQEALDRARVHSDIAIELLPTDIKEDKVVSDFMSTGCGCKKGIGGKPCSTQFSQEWYLYEQIRPYCPDEDKDTTCPKPTVPKPGRSTPGPEQESSQPGPPKRKRTCTGV